MDYRDAKPVAKGSPQAQASKNEYQGLFWHAAGKEEIGAQLLSQGRKLQWDSERRHMLNVRYARLYENMQLSGFEVDDWETANASLAAMGALSYNVVQACIDTLESKMLKNRPRPSFQTNASGGWAMRQKARKLDKFCRGLFYEVDLYRKAQKSGKDGLIFGTGALKWFVDSNTKRLNCERVFIDEVYVDNADGKYGEPRCMYHRKLVSKDVLKAEYPDLADEIEAVGSAENYHGRDSRMVDVWEAWHLPSSKKTKDGRHAITVGAVCLVDEEWCLGFFPIVPFRYSDRILGFWGRGVTERLAGIQKELNNCTTSLSAQIRRRGKGRIYFRKGSVNPAHLSNETAAHVPYTGDSPPKEAAVNVIAPEEFAHIESCFRHAFQEVGVSELSAGSKKPAGLDAAVAMREYNEIESDRFAMLGQRWESYVCFDNVRVALAMIREFCPKNYVVRLPNKTNAIDINWKDIDLDESAYTIQSFPVSSLPNTPAAKLQRIEELKAGGYITQARASVLLDMPDIENEMDLANAVQEDADATISAILDDETPRLLPLEPYQSYEAIAKQATAAYLLVRHIPDMPEDRLDMLRQLIDNAAAAIAAAQQPPPPPEMPAAPAAPAGPTIGDINITTAPPANGAQPAVPPLVG